MEGLLECCSNRVCHPPGSELQEGLWDDQPVPRQARGLKQHLTHLHGVQGLEWMDGLRGWGRG